MSRVLALVFAFLLACSGDVPPPHKLDLNRATVQELEALPAIGPKHARSIMASRNARHGHFERLEDLLSIDGIGPKTIEAIRPLVEVGP
ncbi:MAG: helix-hairpin-helix domain-containing protein [Kofleriaceae bacterium]